MVKFTFGRRLNAVTSHNHDSTAVGTRMVVFLTRFLFELQ
jgi:hypothetical protein